MSEQLLQTSRKFLDAPIPDKILTLKLVAAVCFALFLMVELLKH